MKKEYLDRVIPSAVVPVSVRERIGSELLNSVQMSATKIMISDGRIDRGVWGIATWEMLIHVLIISRFISRV